MTVAHILGNLGKTAEFIECRKIVKRLASMRYCAESAPS